MRIDIIQPQEMPKVPKVGVQDSTGKVNNEQSGESGGSGSAGQRKSFNLPQQSDGTRTEQQVKDVINRMIDSVLNDETSLQFKINDKTHRVVVQIVNKKTQEIIRQIPPEKVVETMASICKLVGINVDEKA